MNITSTERRFKLCPVCRKEYKESDKTCPADGTNLVPLVDTHHEEAINNRYELIQKIATGTTSEVFKANRRGVEDHFVAVKLLSRFESPEIVWARRVERFIKDFTEFSVLSHPNITAIFERGTLDDGRPYMALEYVPGHTLASELASKRPMNWNRLYTVISQLCAGLGHAHEKGIFHQDLKPSEILICNGQPGSDDTTIKLIDFGKGWPWPRERCAALKLSEKGETSGDARYMSPEAITRSQPLNANSNIYSLGCILYEVLYGRLPFEGPDQLTIAMKKLNEEVKYPGTAPGTSTIGPQLLPILYKALQRDPARRFQSMQDLQTSILRTTAERQI